MRHETKIGKGGSSIRIIIQLELVTCGSLINNDQVFNTIITSHAFMIIFFASHVIGGFGNFVVTLIVGTIGIVGTDIAYLRINNIRF